MYSVYSSFFEEYFLKHLNSMFAENFDSNEKYLTNSLKDIKMINDSLLSEKFEIDTDYFHVVDESRLFLQNLMPFRGIRFKEKGLKLILEKFSEIFKQEIKLTTFKIDINKYNLSGSEMEEGLQRYSNFYKDLDFSKLKTNEFTAILVNIVNNQEKLMHASTFIYGIDEKNEKYIILIDPYFHIFADIIDTSCFIASMVRYFKKKIKNVKIFAQSERIQRDSNSCSTISIEMIRQFFTKKQLIQSIITQNSKENLKTMRDENKTTFFKYKLPSQIKRFRQKISNDENNIIDFISSEDKEFNDKYHKNLLINDLKVRLVTQFSSKNKVYDDLSEFKYKKLNVFFVIRAYEYVRFLILLIKNESKKKSKKFEIIDRLTSKQMAFEPKYWLSLIREPESIRFDKRKILQIKKFADLELSEIEIQEEDKIIVQ